MHTAATAVHMTGGVKTGVYVIVVIAGIGLVAFAVRLWNLWH